MKFIVAPDSFKESLTAIQASEALSQGIKDVFPNAAITSFPIADGGEGTGTVLCHLLGGEIHYFDVQDPLGRHTRAALGYVKESKTAIVEVAEAIGIHLVPENLRNIWKSSSYGVGQLLREAMDLGASRIILGLGGSVTNDGGAGMLHALGARILDDAGDELAPLPLNLSTCSDIDISGVDERWQQVEIVLACDVDSPPTGPNGASVVFSSQKGAKENDIPHLDAAIGNWVRVLEAKSSATISSIPGAGAAGALATGLLAFFQVSLVSGAELVLDLADFSSICDDETIVFTGEGKIDFQTNAGKGPAHVAVVSRQAGATVFAFGGIVDSTADLLVPDLFDGIVPISRGSTNIEQALSMAAENLRLASSTVCRILATKQQTAI